MEARVADVIAWLDGDILQVPCSKREVSGWRTEQQRAAAADSGSAAHQRQANIAEKNRSTTRSHV
jgi:hypothetical protein